MIRRNMFQKRIDERDAVAVRFGNNLKMLRIVNNETVENLARLFMLDKCTMSLCEHGLVMPPLSTIERLARYYDVSVDTLMHCDSKKLGKMIKRGRMIN